MDTHGRQMGNVLKRSIYRTSTSEDLFLQIYTGTSDYEIETLCQGHTVIDIPDVTSY